MTTGQKHEAIAAQYYKEMDKVRITVYHYDYAIDKPDKEFLKVWLLKRGCNSLSEYLDYEAMF